MPSVSILLLTKNGAATLPDVLDAAAAQRTSRSFEIVAVDSGSTDGTRELLGARGVRVIRIAPSDFNHGLTRNLGMEACRGEVVVLLVQDAVPASHDWLERLVEPLFAKPALAGTYARQMPHHDASPITRHYLSQWLAARPEPRVTYVAGREAFERMTPWQRFEACVFDHVCSAVRRSVWAEFPYRRTPIAEDLEWARDVLLAGYGIAYVPEAAVIHSHDRSARYELERTYLVHQRLRALFGLATVPSLPGLLRAVASNVPVHVRCAGAGSLLRDGPRALALSLAMPLGQYLGIRAADTGRAYLRARGI